MATKPKSRTGTSNLTKKANVPVWAIALGLVVLVGLGAFFVFKSFASTGPSSESSCAIVLDRNGNRVMQSCDHVIVCVSGNCQETTYGRVNGRPWAWPNDCKIDMSKNSRWVCPGRSLHY